MNEDIEATFTMWPRRRSTMPGSTARVAFILIDGAFTPGLLGALGPDGPGG